MRNRPARENIIKKLLILAAISILGCSLVRAGNTEMKKENENKAKRVVLIGASIGRDWNLSGLPGRTPITGYRFESRAVYNFDKTDALREILSAEKTRPDIIIIKECASSFPGDMPRYKEYVKRWAGMCREKGVTVVLATTVPVVKSFPLRVFLLSLLRFKIRWPGGTFQGIIEYNDWLLKYASSEGIPVMDLEAALRTGPEDRYLRSSFARKDGLHINEKAYSKLDSLLLETLEEIDAQGPQ